MLALRSIVFGVVGLAMAGAATAANYTVDVATTGYNRFTFDSPFEAVVLPPDAPLASEPVALGRNTTLLVEFQPRLQKDVQMVVQMQDGQVFDLTLKPGASRTASWQQPAGPDGDTPVQRPEDEMLVGLFQQALADPNREPDGFKRIDTPSPERIEGLTADFIAAYESDQHRLYTMRLRAERPSPIIPQDLYVKGVQAVYISEDSVGPKVAPIALVLARKEQ